MQRKLSEAGQRYAERREREDQAPRLAQQFPDVRALKLEIEEVASATATQPKHIRRVVVEHAPALFLVPCGNPGCSGEHDLTTAILRSLRARERTFGGESRCHGMTGDRPCERVVRWDATAEYAG